MAVWDAQERCTCSSVYLNGFQCIGEMGSGPGAGSMAAWGEITCQVSPVRDPGEEQQSQGPRGGRGGRHGVTGPAPGTQLPELGQKAGGRPLACGS